MNRKEDVLNAWILIERLSEGTIDKRHSALKELTTTVDNWHEFFSFFMKKQKEKEKVSDKAFYKSGLVIYVDIFNFQEIIDLLREKYNMAPTEEEIINSDKFSFAMYFDKDFNFIPDKLFYTSSGLIRRGNPLSSDFIKLESDFRDVWKRKFEEDFEQAILELFHTYKVSDKNFRYAFVKNLDYDEVQLHSFFINDLEKAKKIKQSENLNRYFSGFSGDKKNLDSKQDSKQYNPYLLEEILQPKNYPLGRFPSNPDYALSFMQQIAVNLALHENNDIRSVNGPPGTGKTTLLKDIFADLVVQQAKVICEIPNKMIPATLTYYEKAKFGILPSTISDKNILVASSNNGAVQNIVKELPKKGEISSEFIELLEEIDYFSDISNSSISLEWKDGSREILTELEEPENWGTFSLEGGSSLNLKNLLLHIEMIERNLNEEYQSSKNVYQEFIDLHNNLEEERKKVQQYSEQIRLLIKYENKYRQQNYIFEKKKKQNLVRLEEIKTKASKELKQLRSKINDLQQQVIDIVTQQNIKNNERTQAERNYELIKTQRPNFLWLQKIFNKTKVVNYFESWGVANESLKALDKEQMILWHMQDNYNKEIKAINLKIDKIEAQVELKKLSFEKLCLNQQSELQLLKRKVTELKRLKEQSDIQEIDFSKSYEELQKFNPWFNKKFRTLQSELFIAALKVRKQFLFENKKHLKAARLVWDKQEDNILKQNGHELIVESWQWLNFAIPVVSTTFASFGRMFRNLNENTLGNLFIDEAGQALPQASIGGIFRSKRILVVGDPFQIKPVLTLDSNMLNAIRNEYQVNEKFISINSSTQTIVDDTSQYGFQKNEDEWIGIPLWVHRRSNFPMFTISNEISYNGLMVQGKNHKLAHGKAEWYDVVGKATNKFVMEQALFLKQLIWEKLQKDPDLRNEIYVISPFRNIAAQLSRELDKIKFTRRENGKPTNVGTVHTFQGKEAKIVYFVLGADSDSKGAASWAVSDPNMMNVAATRAKEEFYIIGDKQLYSKLGSKVANSTISVIDIYNNYTK